MSRKTKEDPILNEILSRGIFSSSLLPPKIQLSLIQEITRKAQDALLETYNQEKSQLLKLSAIEILSDNEVPPQTKLYVCSAKRYYTDSVNTDFWLTQQPQPGTRKIADISGPFDPALACAIAYREQEQRVLGTQIYNPKVAEQLGVTSIVALGQGLASLTGHISAFARDCPDLTTKELIQKATDSASSSLINELARAKENYEFFRDNFNDSKDSISYNKFQASEDRIKGFETGLLLLQQLLAHPWEIQIPEQPSS